jgi:hypothetical protein
MPCRAAHMFGCHRTDDCNTRRQPGGSSRQRAVRHGHRGWKRQPRGTRTVLGGSPSISMTWCGGTPRFLGCRDGSSRAAGASAGGAGPESCLCAQGGYYCCNL